MVPATRIKFNPKIEREFSHFSYFFFRGGGVGAQADAHIQGISFLCTTQKWTKGLRIFGGRSGWCAKIQLGNVLPKVTYILASFFFSSSAFRLSSIVFSLVLILIIIG